MCDVSSGTGDVVASTFFTCKDEGMAWSQPLIPHNGIKYNDKICIDEENCIILPSKVKSK